MATISTIEVKATMEGRPCVVYECPGPRKAICHLLTTHAYVIPPSPLKGGHSGGQISSPVAVVEFEDGTMDTVNPKLIRFLDTAAEKEKYDWEMRPNPEEEQ